jgi:hypothetical protein
MLSVHRPERLVDGEEHDQPLDLTPAREVDRVAEVAAGVGARGGLVASVVAIRADEFVGVGDAGRVGEKGQSDHRREQTTLRASLSKSAVRAAHDGEGAFTMRPNAAPTVQRGDTCVPE